MARSQNPVIHYPRNGLTYMVGHCGSGSVSSTKNEPDVTCHRCKELIGIGAKRDSQEGREDG